MQCYICHQQGDHDSVWCPNGSVTVKDNNWSFEDYQKQNTLEDGKDPSTKFRIAVVVLELQLGCCCNNLSKQPVQVPEGADYFTVPLKHGQQYVMMAAGIWVIVVDSGASRCLFRRRGMFTTYKLMEKLFVYTASGEPIPVVSTDTV